jgi:hypothetical protein
MQSQPTLQLRDVVAILHVVIHPPYISLVLEPPMAPSVPRCSRSPYPVLRSRSTRHVRAQGFASYFHTFPFSCIGPCRPHFDIRDPFSSRRSAEHVRNQIQSDTPPALISKSRWGNWRCLGGMWSGDVRCADSVAEVEQRPWQYCNKFSRAVVSGGKTSTVSKVS